jgi:hypothetical protein
MAVVQVDIIGSQALQGCITRLGQIFWRAIDPAYIS